MVIGFVPFQMAILRLINGGSSPFTGRGVDPRVSTLLRSHPIEQRTALEDWGFSQLPHGGIR